MNLAFRTCPIGPVAGLAAALLAAPAAAEPDFYLPPGDLIPDSGQGVAEYTVFAPGMRFPIEVGPAYPNSQVYGNGGLEGPGGSQCDAVNYSYPWRDNYCEKRSWDMPLCPAGTGHQGQDIRGPTCEDKKHQIVATAAGQVTNVGSYSVYVTTPSGQRFDYLHGALDTLAIASGDFVETGDPLVKLSNNMGNTPTSIHLHFNIKQDVGGVGFVYVSPYMSLVRAYEELMGLGNKPPTGVFDQADCATLRGWAQDPDAPEAAVTVEVYFGGAKDDPAATPVQVVADLARDDLCQPLGSCAHGFELDVPISLRDGLTHAVHAYALDDAGGEPAELELSPGEFTCAPPPIPAGVRRWIVSPESLAAWQFSPFWQAIRTTDAAVEAIPEAAALGETPTLVRSDADPTTTWLIDDGFRREVDPEIAGAWNFALATADVWPAAAIQVLPEGTPVRPEPVLLQGEGPKLFLIDDRQCDPDVPNPACGEPGSPASSDEGSGQGTADPPTGGAGEAASGEPGTSTGAAGADDGGGCGCTHAPGGGLLLVALARRRRRPQLR